MNLIQKICYPAIFSLFSLGIFSGSSNQTANAASDGLIQVNPIKTTSFEAENAVDQSNVTIEKKTSGSNGKDVGGIYNSSKVGYDLNFKTNGKYRLDLRWAVGKTGTTKNIATINLDGTPVSSLNGTYTGGWGDNANQWKDISKNINVTKGPHSLQVAANTSGFNLDSLKIQKVGNYNPNQALKSSKAPIVKFHGVGNYFTSTELSQSQLWYKQPTLIKNRNSQKRPLNLTKTDNTKVPTIYIDPKKQGQTFLGMGTSVEPSTIYNLSNMNDFQRKKILRSLLDPVHGAGMTLFRICIGSPDFTGTKYYTYYDNKPEGYGNKTSYDTKTPASKMHPDWNNKTGKGFSIQKDLRNHNIDVLHELLQEASNLGIRNQVKFFASSWTAPGWMKENDTYSKSSAAQPNNLLLKGGTLRNDMVNNLARYEVRFLEEYAKQGIKIYGLTVQNEPKNETNYPSMVLMPKQNGQVAVKIRQYASHSKILKKQGINYPKIWAFDHNFANAKTYVDTMFNQVPQAKYAVNGVAFHDYSGEPTAMKAILNEYLPKIPNFTVNLTERSVWGTSGADRIIQYLRNDSSSYNAWVTMLDSDVKPTGYSGSVDPSLLVRKAGSSNVYWNTPEFYMMGQFGRFIRPGMKLIASNYGSSKNVTDVVFYNPQKHQYICVVSNQTLKKQQFKVQINGKQFLATIPAKNIGTYVWH